MGKLIQNEWIKIFKRKSSYVMIGLVILISILTGFLFRFIETMDSSSSGEWKVEITTQNDELQQQMDSNSMPETVENQLNAEIAINEYRIENNLPPANSMNMWECISESAANISIVGLFVIIIAAGIVANEFSWGTVKMLLIQPYKRWKILLAKYLTVILYYLLMLAILFVSAAIVGALFFGLGSVESSIHLAYVDGQVVEQSLLLYLVKVYFLNSISTLLLATMAFMISSMFRINSLAIGVSISLLLMGESLTSFIALKFDWAKYILFANTNLMQYINGTPLVEGMTMPFSITMLLIYFIIFQVLAFLFFTKRDVSA